MTIETATYINTLNASNPGVNDAKSEGDDHLRLIKSTVKATFPNIAGAVSPTHADLNVLAGVSSTGSALSAVTSINGASIGGFKNVVINGGFTINQRGYVSGAALAAGSFGHDRWKAGGGGGDYSFTQLASSTTITIAANKTLIQVVEDKMIAGTAYVISWTGTAQCRNATNGAIPASAYAASPVVMIGQAAGNTMSIEFGNGASSCTLGNVQIEQSSGVASAFESRPYGLELLLAQRYCCKTFPPGTAPANNAGTAGAIAYMSQVAGTAAGGGAIFKFPVTMRGAPTILLYNPSAGGGGDVWYNASSATDSGGAVRSSVSADSALITNPQVSGDGSGRLMFIHALATAEL